MSTFVSDVFAFLLAALWESTAIVLLVWIALKCIARVNATTRYAVWFAALIVSLALPALTSHLPTTTAPPAISGVEMATGVRTAPDTAEAFRNVAAPSTRIAVPTLHLSVFPAIANALALVWIGVAAFLLIRLAASLNYLERLKRDSLPVQPELRVGLRRWNGAAKGGRDVRLCTSDAIGVPVAIGLFDSMILLPSDYLALDPNELDCVLLHELAHLRRRDDWTNALQRVVSALLFFSPAIAFACARLDVEREVACDDGVLDVESDPLIYANCLARVTRLAAWPQHQVAAPGIFTTRRGTSLRIERLLDATRDTGLRVSPVPFAAALLAFCLVLGAAVFAAPSLTFASPTGDAQMAGSIPTTASQLVYSGDWDIRAWPEDAPQGGRVDFFAPISPDLSKTAPGVNLSLHYPVSSSNNSGRATLAQLGLDAASLQGDDHRIRFTIRYDAGTFVCDGIAGRGLAKGTFRFEPDPRYVQAFGDLRGAAPTPRQEVMAAMFDLQLAYVEAIAAAGMRDISFDDLIQLKMFGVTAADMKIIHDDFPSADASVITGVRMMKGGPADIHALHLALPAAALDMLIGLQTLGVTPAYVSALQKAGIRDLTADNVAALRVSRVDQAFADRLASQGPYGLSTIEVAHLAMKSTPEASP
jgi:beta-lactamase regulating signal transducer with metallopeptidase domain